MTATQTKPRSSGDDEVSRLEAEVHRIEQRFPDYSYKLLYLVMLASIVDGFDRSILSTVFEDVRREFDVSDSGLGALTGAYAMVAALSVLPFGFLADRMSRVKLIALGFVPWAIAMVWQGLAPSFGMMFVARLFLGTIEGTNGPSTPSLLGDYYRVEERTRVFGIERVGLIAGYGFGPIFGGLTAAAFGWRSAFVVWGLVGLFIGGLVLKLLPEPERGIPDALYRAQQRLAEARRRQADGEPAPEATAPLSALAPAGVDYRRLTAGEAIGHVLKIRTLWILMFGQFVLAFNGSAMATWPATFYRRYHGFSVGGAGLIAGGNALMALFGLWYGTRRGGRMVRAGNPHHRIALISVAYMCSGLFLAVCFAVSTTGMSLPFLFVGSMLQALPSGILLALQADVVAARLRGRALGISSMLRVAGTAAAPVIFGVVSDGFGLRTAMLLVAPNLVLGGLATLPAFRTYGRDLEFAQLESLRQMHLESEDQPTTEGAPDTIDLREREAEADEWPVVDFPIADYETLTVKQILPLLPMLYVDEIGQVEERELAHRARVTILNRLAELRQLTAGAPDDAICEQWLHDRARNWLVQVTATRRRWPAARRASPPAGRAGRRR